MNQGNCISLDAYPDHHAECGQDRWEIFTRILLHLFVLSIPCENLFYLPGVGSLSRVLGIFLAIIASIAIIRGRLRKLPIEFYAATAFVLWIGMTCFWSIDAVLSMQMAKTYAQHLVLLFICWHLCRTRKECESLIVAYLAGCTILLGSILLAFVQGDTARSLGDVRYTGMNMNENDAALATAIGIGFAGYLWNTAGSRLKTAGCAVYTWLAVLGIVLTGSRAGFLCMIPSGFGFLWMVSKKGTHSTRTKRVIYALVLVFCAFNLAPAQTWERLGTIGYEIKHGDMTHRKDIWKEGISVGLRHAFSGYGAGTFPVAVDAIPSMPMVAHNSYISVFVEEGIIGLFLFGSMWILLFCRILGEALPLRIMMMGTVLTYALGIMTLSWEYTKTTWFLAATLLCLVRSPYQESESTQT